AGLAVLGLVGVAIGRHRSRPGARLAAAFAPVAVLIAVSLCGKLAAVWLVPGPGRSQTSDWHTVLDRSFLTHADLFAFGMAAAIALIGAEGGLFRLPTALVGGAGARFLLYLGVPFGVFGYYL